MEKENPTDKQWGIKIAVVALSIYISTPIDLLAIDRSRLETKTILKDGKKSKLVN